MKNLLIVREAQISDVDRIFELLEIYSVKKVVLSRSRDDIALFIGNFVVAEYEGEVCGCAAVRDFGNDLLEIRSLVVAPELQGKGVGKAIIGMIVEKVKAHREYWRLFALTLQPEFFRTLGFREVPKALFPEKIWSDCSKCAKRDKCDEIALLLESE
ncbi:MAG: GNAT family N-acetyltransferase [Lentisphaeria bacterium]|nr:GNAT family N-acetyltransferase [Lentisphaeria bacterium]